MNRRRLGIALGIALLLSATVTFVINRRIRMANLKPKTLRYVVAAKALQSGEILKAENLSYAEWPMTLPIEGAVTKSEELAGRSLIYPVAASQPIIQKFLAAPGSGIGLTVKIPEGMRATSVRSDEVVGVAGFLFPGSHVDVLMTLKGDTITALPATQIVLQDVEVLTTGQNIEPDPNGKAQSVNVVTVLLTPQDAQKLVLASNQGQIHFVLRNGGDHGQVKPIPVQIAELAGLPHVARVAAVTTSAGQVIPAKQPYMVETIMGDQQTVTRF